MAAKTPKNPTVQPFDEGAFRDAFGALWSCLRHLEQEGALERATTIAARISPRPGTFKEIEYLETEMGLLRVADHEGLVLEFTPNEGETIVANLPCRFLADPTEERSMWYNSSIHLAARSKKAKRGVAAALTCFQHHLDQEIISTEGNTAIIGYAEPDTVALNTIATMLRLHGDTFGYGKMMPGDSIVSAPFLFADVKTWSPYCWRAADSEIEALLKANLPFAIRKKAAVTAVRRRWRGTKSPIYYWNLDFEPVSEEIKITPAKVELARILAAQIGLSLDRDEHQALAA